METLPLGNMGSRSPVETPPRSVAWRHQLFDVLQTLCGGGRTEVFGGGEGGNDSCGAHGHWK